MGPQSEYSQDPVATVREREPEPPALAALCWPDLTFSRDGVISMAWPAYCWTPGGELWEYENEAFWITSRRDRSRRRVDDVWQAPADGWSHLADCDCPSCRVTKH
jgi:hypothetical protein